MKKTVRPKLIKKYQAILLGLAIITFGAWASPPGAAAAEPVPGNLIVNPDMQAGSDEAPDNWTLSGFSDVFSGNYPVEGPTAGDKAAEIVTTVHTDGDAKWVHDRVSVSPGAQYTFRNSYRSNISTTIVAAYSTSLAAEPSRFMTVATLNSTGGQWAENNLKFTVPLGYNAVSVYHVISSVGSLATTNYSLVLSSSAANNLFTEGIVSLTFDDGWTSQYDNALPILKNSSLPATFFIISQPLIDANNITSDNLVDANNHPDVSRVADSNSVSWSNIYTDPSIKSYRYSAFYTSTATSVVEISYQLEGGPVVTETIGTLVASPDGLSRANFLFTLPGNPENTVTPLTITHSSETGDLTVSSEMVNRYFMYMDTAQVLETQAAGIEIGNHTVSHCNLVTGLCPDGVNPEEPNPLTAREEIETAKQTLVAEGAEVINTIAYPYGASDEAVAQVTEDAGHIAGRTVSQGFNTKQDDPYALKAQVVTATTPVEQVYGWIDEAVDNKWWLVLVFHQVEDQAEIDAKNHVGAVTPETLASIAAYLENVPVKTFGEGAALLASSQEGVPNDPPENEPTPPPVSNGGGGVVIATTHVPSEIEAIGVPLEILPEQSGRLETTFDLTHKMSLEWPRYALDRKVIVTTPLGRENNSSYLNSLPSSATLLTEGLFRISAVDADTGSSYQTTNADFKINLTVPLPGDLTNIALYRLDAGATTWVRVNGVTYDSAAGTATLETNRLGLYGLFSITGTPDTLAASGIFAPESPEEETSSSNEEGLAEFVTREKLLVISHNQALAERLAGRIVLQVQAHGEAWYINPVDSKKYFLGRPNDAYTIMRRLSLGVSNQDWEDFAANRVPDRLSGRILLKVEDWGRAYYVNPLDMKMHYLGRPADAFNIMRTLGLGITNSDVRKINVGELE